MAYTNLPELKKDVYTRLCSRNISNLNIRIKILNFYIEKVWKLSARDVVKNKILCFCDVVELIVILCWNGRYLTS